LICLSNPSSNKIYAQKKSVVYRITTTSMEAPEEASAEISTTSTLGNADVEKAPEVEAPVDKNGSQLKHAVTAQDWTGPNDPENPQNWSMKRKVYHALIPTLLAFVV
jgi:hypothetical protein